MSAASGPLPHRPDAEISNLELPYSPPFSAAMDVLNALGNTAETSAGKNRTINGEQVLEMWKARDLYPSFGLRGRGMLEPFVQKYPHIWKSIPQDELELKNWARSPRTGKRSLVCNTACVSG